jgi:hypothetical protein
MMDFTFPSISDQESSVRILAPARLSHPVGHPKPHVHRQACQGDEGTQFMHHARNLRRDGRDDREGHSFNPKGLGSKVFRSNVCDTCFPKHFRTPNYIVKYDGETNLSVWLEDYHLACRAGGVDDDLFIM